ncbi:MAG: nicotinate phosphoribosyltransferase [Terracidiphilus sp.]|jgi:nicotinamide phosphoribosyltransferase
MIHLTESIIYRSDSYKYSHHKLLPPGTETIYSYLESRGGKFKDVVFFGLQYILEQYFSGVVVTADDVEEARKDVTAHMGPDVFNYEGWMRIVNVHGGKLPLRIHAVPEGTVLGPSQVLMTVENTDPALPWLTNFAETLLMQVWYPITVASQQYAKRKMMLGFLEKTGTPESIDFKWHDFGYRGSTSQESAAIGGAAHLLSFKGTDTFIALQLIKKFYGGENAGFSIPASEHSTITSWGREHESDAYSNMLQQYPTGIIACVSDSYDIEKACRELWGNKLRLEVLGRDGMLVVRPDSGDPAPVILRILSILGEAFGTTTNAKGYTVLHPKVRVIQGDGINYESAYEILTALERRGWSIDNLALGEGSGALQMVNRDTLKMAIKCSAVKINGQWSDVYKDPATDPGKTSKRGRLALVQTNGQFHTIQKAQALDNDLLRLVWENGSLIERDNWTAIRSRVLQDEGPLRVRIV